MTATAELTAKEVRVIGALIAGGSRQEAATAARVPLRTFYRIQKLPHVIAEVRRQRTAALDGIATQLVAYSPACVRVMYETATGIIKTDPVRVSAARAVLDLANRFEETATLATRLAELEAAVAATQPAPKGLSWSQ